MNLVWKVTPTTTATAGYARYFVPPPFELVAPTTITKFVNTTAAPTLLQDDTVKAERSNYFDVGLNQVILPGLAIGFDAYYKQANNLIDEGQFGAPIILTPFNYQKGLVKGIESTISYDIGDWSFYGNLAFSRAVGKTITSAQFNFQPDELAYIANHFIYLDHDQRVTGSAGLKYRLPRTKTLFSADLTAGSGLRATPPGGTCCAPSTPRWSGWARTTWTCGSCTPTTPRPHWRRRCPPSTTRSPRRRSSPPPSGRPMPPLPIAYPR